jgi:hypothetical protein
MMQKIGDMEHVATRHSEVRQDATRPVQDRESGEFKKVMPGPSIMIEAPVVIKAPLGRRQIPANETGPRCVEGVQPVIEVGLDSSAPHEKG